MADWAGVCAWLMLAAVGLAGPANAQVLELRPVQLQFDKAHPAQAFSLINRSAAPAVVQVRVFKWSQGAGGEDVLTPAEDMIVSPPFAQLGVGETQVVRVRYLGGQTDAECSYRLLIDQLPPPRKDGAGVRTALRLSMPAFVEPLRIDTPKVNWTWSHDPAGGTDLAVVNHGSAHMKVADLKIRLPNGEALTPPPVGSAYILSGAVHRWRLDDAVLAPSGSKLPTIQVAGVP